MRNEFWGWTIGRLRLSTFPLKVHSGPILIRFNLHSRSFCLLLRMRQLYSRTILYLEIENSVFPLFFRLLSHDCCLVLLILFSDIFSYREKLEHDMLNSNFLKNSISPQNHIFCGAQGQTSKYDRLSHNVTFLYGYSFNISSLSLTSQSIVFHVLFIAVVAASQALLVECHRSN